MDFCWCKILPKFDNFCMKLNNFLTAKIGQKPAKYKDFMEGIECIKKRYFFMMRGRGGRVRGAACWGKEKIKKAIPKFGIAFLGLVVRVMRPPALSGSPQN